MLKRSLFSFSSGMMLMECLFAIAISGILFLCLSRAYPQIMNMLIYSYQQYQLDIFLKERLLILETQLRRTGYCYGDCVGFYNGREAPLKIGHHPYEAKNSCIIFAYDMNSNGRWEKPSSKESDYFGIRLKNGQLEQLRGVKECDSSGWQHFFESDSIEVTAFILEPNLKFDPIKGKSFFSLSISLTFHLKQNPAAKSHYHNVIYLRNMTSL